jgi:hypothetical protein
MTHCCFRRRGQTAHALIHRHTHTHTHTHTNQKVPKLTFNHWTLRSFNEKNEFVSGYLHRDVTSNSHFVVCVFFVVLFCVLFLPIYIVLYFLFVYSFTDQCHRIETQQQLINIISYTIPYHIIHHIIHDIKSYTIHTISYNTPYPIIHHIIQHIIHHIIYHTINCCLMYSFVLLEHTETVCLKSHNFYSLSNTGWAKSRYTVNQNVKLTKCQYLR